MPPVHSILPQSVILSKAKNLGSRGIQMLRCALRKRSPKIGQHDRRPRHANGLLLLWVTALGGLLLYLVFTLHLCLLAVAYPYQLDYGEGLVLHQVRLLAQGQSIYKGMDGYPYIFSNYPPLFQALVGPLVAVFGPAFQPGRVLAILAALGLGAILYKLVRRAGGGVLAASIASLLFLGSPHIYHWAPLLRIDLPALFFSTLGVLVVWSATTPVVATHAGQTSWAPPSIAPGTMPGLRAGQRRRGGFATRPQQAHDMTAPGTMPGLRAGQGRRGGFATRPQQAHDMTPGTMPDGAGQALPGLRDTDRSLHTVKTVWASLRSGRAVFLAGLLFVLALYTKQSYVAAPAAALLYLALHNRRAALQLVCTLAILGLIPFLVLELATGGAFSFDLFTANVNPFGLTLLMSQVRDFVTTFAVVIALAAVGAASSKQHAASVPQPARVPTSPRPRVSFFGCYGLAAVATILLAGKVGAWQNYFFEALFMLCVYAGLGIERLVQSKQAIVQWAVPLGLLVQLVLMWHDPRIGVRAINEDRAANRALAPLIARQTGMILSEDLGLLLVNGQDVPYFSFQYAQLAEVGRWDQHWETDNLRAGRFALVVLERGTREDPQKFRRFTRQVLSAVDAGYGLAAEVGKYRVYAPMPMLRALDAIFGDQIALLGYRLDAATASGGEISIPAADAKLPSLNPYPPRLRLTLLWQARAAMTTDYKVFVHLEDVGSARRSQSDAMPFFGLYPTHCWTEGEIVRDYYDIDLPAGLPPGRYVLRVGLYDPATGSRLAQPDGSTSLLLASLPLGPAARPTPPPNPRLISFANGISLTGYDLSATRLASGSPLTVVLFWHTDTYVDRDLSVFVHLVGADGKPLAQADGPPQLGAYPTSSWNPGQDVADVHSLSIPRALPPGTYRLLVGLYDQPAATRILLAGGEDNVLLSDIQVSP